MSRFSIRFVAAVASAAAVLGGLPTVLVAVALQRFDNASPLHGVNAPWRWNVDDVRSWGRRLTEGLDSSAALVDLFFRVALIVGWICVAVVVYTVVDEMVFQLRHGMPSARRRRLGGLGPLGRRIGSLLIAVLPLAVTATPTLAGGRDVRPSAGIMHDRPADLIGPATTVVELLVAPIEIAAPAASSLGTGWSVVEVQRGDSVWAIADRVADGRDVAVIAQQIVAANLGTVMSDGHRFSTPALIEPGWLLNVPVAGDIGDDVFAVDAPANLPASGLSYTVVAGDSYWQIAEDHLDNSASNAQIAVYTADLIRINAPTLHHSHARLIRPGDVLQLGLQEPDAAVPAPVESPPPIAVQTAEVAIAETETAPPSAVTPLAPAELPATTVVSPISSQVGSPAQTTVSERLVHAIDDSSDGIPIRPDLAAAMLLAGGAIAALDARRRQQLRRAHVGARLLPPTDEAIETETLLRSLNPADRLARMDLALRSAAPDLARQQTRVLAAEIADDGEIRLYTDRPAMMVARHWLLDVEAGAWRLPASVSLADLAERARMADQPCPAIVHIGECGGGQLFVDLEALGALSIDAPACVAASIVRCAAASLAVSPFAESSRVFTVGIEIDAHLGSLNVESHDSVAQAVDAVRATVGSTGAATSGSTTTFALRAAGHGGEAWEPSLLLVVGMDDVDDLALLSSLTNGGGGRGVGVMIDRPLVGAGAVLRSVGDDFVLEPLGRRVTPVGLSTAEVSAVDNLLDAAERPLIATDGEVPVEPIAVVEFCERQHELIVQLLGPVAVQTRAGESVDFDRSKAQELVVWLTQHRRRPTRMSARTALWDLAVRDATFSNVVSDARRAMAKLVMPPAGQEWIGRTMNEDLPLHDMVVSDVDLLADRVAAARGLEPHDAIAVLQPGVALINGMAFEGTSYLWPDAEGITSALVLLATSAAGELAGHYLTVGDVDGVFWATGQGLKVLAGHEELIALRMRAHALRGDLAGVRSEWDSYERAINADSWNDAEPSPKLLSLRRELLSPSLAS
ncbi:MAG TPA: LysM peptidoglycan-binding domain-containing protein [Ilumatobacteraceae bacterium]|nr:LysM peptidoglycan-binding domain-containing protein [Ilumatobacteraceae bacterium]